MAIMLPFIKKDVFGGPAGSTNAAVQSIVEGILRGQSRQHDLEQNQLASQMFQDSLRSQQNYESAMPGYMNEIMNYGSVTSPDSPYEPAGMQAPTAPAAPQDFVEQLLGNPQVEGKTKERWMKIAEAQSGIEKEKAYADYLRDKGLNTTPEKRYEVEYWDATGKGRPGGKFVVAESNYNAAAEQMRQQGWTLSKPTEKNAAGSSEFERIVGDLVARGAMPKDQADKLLRQRVQKMAEAGDGGGPGEAIKQLEYEAKVAFLAGKASARQKAIIGQDGMRALSIAAAQVDSDFRNQVLPEKERIAKIVKIAQDMMAGVTSDDHAAPGATRPPLPPGFKVD